MKYVWRLVLVVVLLVVGAFSYRLLRAARARHADEVYHAALTKTLVVRSKSFIPDGEFPDLYTCKGLAKSPELEWRNAPPGTRSYALTMVDWDAPSPIVRLYAFTHWILYNIPQDRSEIEDAITSDELHRDSMGVGQNTSGAFSYAPPCPPHGRHRYSIRIYALDLDQIRPAGATLRGLQDAMHGHILAFGETAGFSGQ